MKIDEHTWALWLKLSQIYEYEDYNLQTHNYLQMNSLFKELKWIRKNKQKYSKEELIKRFDNFVENL
jgi:hypothetical protein